MGGFYGSIQIRTDDRDAVLWAAALVAEAASIRCLIGPALAGWVGVYPQNGGQDPRLGQAIAEQLHGDVLHTVVHDDDVMVYWLYRGGKLADAYWSSPGYFRKEDRAAQEKLAGNPPAFAGLINGQADSLRRVLHREDRGCTFEAIRLEEFATLIGIRNAVTSYELLKAGEVSSIEGWEQFQEVPENTASAQDELSQRRDPQAELAKLQFKRDWLLLTDVVEDHRLPRACAAGGGILVAWEGHGRADGRIEFYRRPWGEAEPGEIETGGQVNAVTSDATGQRVAMALGNRVVVWDVNGWKPVIELVESDWAIQAALSDDGTLLGYASRDGVFIHDIQSGRRITGLTAHGTTALAFHPSGDWLISADTVMRIAATRGADPWRELYPGGQAPVSEELSTAIQKQMTHVDLEAMEAKWRASLENAVQKLAGSVKDALASAQLVARMHQQMDKQLEQMRASFANLKAGKLPAPRRGKENILCAGFTRDGRHLWCGTDHGLRVYDWQAVLSTSASSAMPVPLFNTDPIATHVPSSPHAPIYAAVDVPSRHGLLFGGYQGVVYEFSFDTGHVRPLLTPPDGGAIVSLALSKDAAAVAVSTRPGLGDNAAAGKEERAVWQIWSYPAMVNAVGNSSALQAK